MHKPLLTTTAHDRDVAGLQYVYPVMSRRAGGLSIGVNFNPNNACNWRCIYCQVPGLKPGNAPAMDFKRLDSELRGFLSYVQQGEFFADYRVPANLQAIKDIAISGNGEPTSLVDFAQAVALVAEIATAAGVFPASRFVLISNGSLLHQPGVQAGLQVLAAHGGELWLKIDSATSAGRRLVNHCGQSQAKLLAGIETAAALCPTRLQTCMFHYHEQVWTMAEKQAYLQFLATISRRGIGLAGIMLYSLARPSCQPEAAELTAADPEEMAAFAAEIRSLGFAVSVST